MTPTLFMLEWRKMKGDAFSFHDFFREIKRKFTGQTEEPASHMHSPAAAAAASADPYGDDEDGTAAGASPAANPRMRGGSTMIANKRVT